jgi:Rrf2 family protein
MRLSLQAQYAICGIFDLAYNGRGEPIQVRVIGERQRSPSRYLEQIFQRLRRADLVRGKRGPGGGYVLARPPDQVTLREVVAAVEGPVESQLGGGPPPRDGRVPFRPGFLWSELAEEIGQVFGAINLDDLCRRAAKAGVRRADGDLQMYHI